MHDRLPDEGDVWRRPDGTLVEVMALRADGGGRYVRLETVEGRRASRVALGTFTLGGTKAWRYVRRAR